MYNVYNIHICSYQRMTTKKATLSPIEIDLSIFDT